MISSDQLSWLIDESYLDTISVAPLTELGLIQASSVIAPVMLRLGLSGTWTKASVPFRLKAWPTSPAANVAPPCSVPLLLSAESLATVPAGLSSARYQLTSPSGGSAA